MNIKPIIILIVLTAILSVSIVAAYENVEHNSNADGGISASYHDVRNKLHNANATHDGGSENYGVNSPQDLMFQGYLYGFDMV